MTTWSLEGTYVETCNCDVACPCIFLSNPTQGNCTALVGWHIDRGADGETALDDLNVAFAVYSPGNMAQVKWEVAAYLDDRASPAQHQSLARIFGGQAGGHPAVLAQHVGKLIGIDKAPIAFSKNGKTVSLRLGKLAGAEVEQIAGQGGGVVEISGHALAIAPGYPVTVARSKKMWFDDHGNKWSESGRNAFFSPFSYRG